jgi:capsular polysaccharide biosynthesis protein
MEEIDIKAIINIVIRRWWILLSSALICVIITGIWTFIIAVPVYQSYTTLFVGRNIQQTDPNQNTSVAYNDLMASSLLVKDYREFAKSALVTNEVIRQLHLSKTNSEQIASEIAVDAKNETRIIQITVSDTDPKLAMNLADKVAEVFTDKVVGIMKVENVQVIDKAQLPTEPVKPNKKLNMAIALLLGLMLGGGIIFLIEYLDNTVKTPEDVKKVLDLPVIGVIPVFEEDR